MSEIGIHAGGYQRVSDYTRSVDRLLLNAQSGVSPDAETVAPVLALLESMRQEKFITPLVQLVSLAELRRQTKGGQFDVGLWTLLSQPVARHQLREALIARYFPEEHDKLAAIAATSRSIPPADQLKEELPPGRDGAFRRTILEIYDYRCAACGVRVLLDQSISLVEAAHLIPFNVSRNDKPNNGIALCPNHHWAMRPAFDRPGARRQKTRRYLAREPRATG